MRDHADTFSTESAASLPCPSPGTDADALSARGWQSLRAGRPAEAEALFRAAARLRPAPEAVFSVALALEGLGRFDAAADAYRTVLAFQPDLPEALVNLGALRNARGDTDAAILLFRRALASRPHHWEALSNLAVIQQERGMPHAAAAAFRRALALNPASAILFHNLSLALVRLSRLEEAALAGRRAVTLRPDHAEARATIGNIIRERGDSVRSAAVLRRALALRPDFPEALCNLANALHDLGRLADADATQSRALACRPDFPDARWNRSLIRLLTGDFRRGWDDYEWRWRCPGFKKAQGSSFDRPLWQGEAGEGRTLLVHAEQGFGDTLQFVRYAPLARARGWRVVVEAPRPLLRLLGTLPGVGDGVTLVAQGDPLPPFDAQCPMLSLPRAFATGWDTIPAAVPYLSAEPERAAAWNLRLPPRTPDALFRVGVVWQGNPQTAADRGRSFPLAALEPLAGIPGVRLVSLQKNHGLDQLDGLPDGMRVTPLGADFDSGPDAFLDTAAAMRDLDLIVTSDTSVAHLAGALGRPVWLALKAVPDWRWGMEGEGSPWYPTMRLFRQTRAGDWRPVFSRMAGELFQIMMAKAMRGMDILVPVSPGELLDKLTILDIKRERIADPAKRRNVEVEHDLLARTVSERLPATAELAGLTAELKAVNTALWVIEDDIRDCERAGDFGPRFIELARAVYRTNDRRAALKRRINECLGSALVEEKSYAAY